MTPQREAELREKFFKFSFPTDDLLKGPDFNEIADFWLAEIEKARQEVHELYPITLPKGVTENPPGVSGYSGGLPMGDDLSSTNNKEV